MLEDCISGILSKCYQSVKSIDIEECEHIKNLASHIKRCTELKIYISNGTESASDLAEIGQACQNLQVLDLTTLGKRLTEDVVLSVAAHCPLLVHFKFRSLSNAAMIKVADSCPLLQEFFVDRSDITDATVVSICKRLPLLKCVELYQCDNLTQDAAVLAAATAMATTRTTRTRTRTRTVIPTSQFLA
jgi:hypothetical protein